MTGRLGPPKERDWGRDIGVPEKRILRYRPLSLCEKQRRAVRGSAREGSHSHPHTRWRSGVGFPSVAVGGRLEAGAGPGAGAGWGLWAAGVAGDTQERRPPRREQRRSPDGASLHGAGSLRAVATRQPPTSPGPRRAGLLAVSCQRRGVRRLRRSLGPGVPGASYGAVQPLPSPPSAGTAVAGPERGPRLGR